jgi:hypothetical protein
MSTPACYAIQEILDRLALCLQAQPRAPLPVGRDPQVADVATVGHVGLLRQRLFDCLCKPDHAPREFLHFGMAFYAASW